MIFMPRDEATAYDSHIVCVCLSVCSIFYKTAQNQLLKTVTLACVNISKMMVLDLKLCFLVSEVVHISIPVGMGQYTRRGGAFSCDL